MMKQNWLELEHKTFIVTGGASGIGRAIGEELLADGANVAVCDMNPEAPEYQNGTPLYIPTNVTDRASVDAMVARSGISAVWTASSTTRASTSRACSSTKGTSTNWTKRSGTRS